MSLTLYMDVHVRRAVTNALRLRKIDVLTAQDDTTTRLSDPELLDRAHTLGRVLFSQDDDLLAEAAARQRSGREFSGLIYAHQIHVPVGRCIDDLALLAQAEDAPALRNRVIFLPLT
ncbi:MAG: DUF5615 family PIN-like protein [Opitutae bacterium]|nr:DUF5615 family PIN-like protein [Opitutae bacterium]